MSLFIPNIDNNAVEFMREESVYIDGNKHTATNAHAYAANEVSGQTGQAPSTNSVENGVRRNSFRIKGRKEKDSRWLAEQTNRLHERFNLPPSDEIIASCSAALLKKILLRGRIYVTTYHLCFYTSLFGKVTKEAFPYKSLARVENRRGGLVANAIKLYFANEDVSPITIGSLNNRDKVFSLIQERLRILNPNASEEIVKDGDSNSTFSDNVSQIEFAPSRNSASVEISLDSIDASTDNDKSEDAPIKSKHVQPKPYSVEDKEKSNNHTTSEQLKTRAEELVDPLIWCTADDIVGVMVSNSYNKRKERARMVLNAPVRDVFNLLYISDWIKEYHQAVKNYDVHITEWQRDEIGRMYRDVRFRRALGLKLGPKETRVEEKQWITYADQGGVVIEVQGKNLDVPYASYFVVESFFEMSPMNNGRDTLLVASVSVSFSKSTFLQGQIESGALSETKNVYEKLVALSKERVDEHLYERAATETPQPSMKAELEEDESIHGPNKSMKAEMEEDESIHEPNKGTNEHDLQAISEETEKHQDLNKAAEEHRTDTCEEKKNVSSSEVSIATIYNHSSYGVAPDGSVRHTTVKLERTDILNSYLGASLFVLAVSCILFALLLMRVEQLATSLQNVTIMVENGLNERRC